MIKVLLFADLSPMDDSLFYNAELMMNELDISEICVCHYVEIQEVTQDVQHYLKDLEDPLDEILADEFKKMAEDHNVPEDILSFKIHMHGGKDSLVEWINKSDYNLCMFGKKIVHVGLGGFSSRLLRLVDKPVLFITETTNFSINRVLFPTEFSAHTERAAVILNDVKGDRPYEFLSVLHVYHLDPVYFPFMVKHSERMIKKVEDHVKNELKSFCKKNFPNQEVEQVAIYADDKPTARIIYDYAITHRVDMVVIGIKGDTDDENILVGSVADSLIQTDKNIPVLLIR